MATPAKKATFSLREEVLSDLDDAVSQGAATSKNAFVEKAIVREIREWRREQRRARWRQGSRDPLLLRDIEEVDSDFGGADAEIDRRIV